MTVITGEPLPEDAPRDLIDALDIVAYDVRPTWTELQTMPQAVLEYLPMVRQVIAEHRERVSGR